MLLGNDESLALSNLGEGASKKRKMVVNKNGRVVKVGKKKVAKAEPPLG